MRVIVHDWADFYRSLAVDVPFGTPVPKPTPAQLDEYERRVGRKLPKSYRAFITVFGPGSFSSMLQIAAPGYRYLDSTCDIDIANESYTYNKDDMSIPGIAIEDNSRLSRLWFFGIEGCRNYLGWDPDDIRNVSESEYGIYRVVSACDVKLVATTFRQLVEDTCTVLFAEDETYDEDELGPKRAYEPAVIREE